MAPLIIGIGLIAAGMLMIDAEFRACEYERKNIGPILLLFGVLALVGAAVEYVAT